MYTTMLTFSLIITSLNGEQKQSKTCQDLMQKAGCHELFGTNTGHVLHGMTLRQLKNIDPVANGQSNIPSLDWTKKIVLPYPNPIFFPDETCFYNPEMKTTAYVIHESTNERTHNRWAWSTMARLAHEFHMTQIEGTYIYNNMSCY